MTNEQKRVKDWMQKAGQECPDKPTMPSLEVRKLRARLILEEAVETVEALGLRAYLFGYPLAKDNYVLSEETSCNLTEIADGMADLQYVNIGTAVACGIDLELVFQEVCRSNDSKWWSGTDLMSEWNDGIKAQHLEDGTYCVTDKGGKVIKSPSYSPANIAPILEAQCQSKPAINSTTKG